MPYRTYFEIYLVYDTVCHIPGISRNMYEILRKQQEKRALKEKRAEYTSLKKKLDDQCAINARQLKALAAKRNEYPVLWFIKINCLVAHCNFCVLAE